MKGFQFSKAKPKKDESLFERLFDIFKDILIHTSGDVAEAISWLTTLDKEFEITSKDYGISDFIEDLRLKGYLTNERNQNGNLREIPTSKLESSLRKSALNEIFDDLKQSGNGEHPTNKIGHGDVINDDFKKYEFGDKLENIDISESLKNAQINHGIDQFKLSTEDLEIRNTFRNTHTCTVLMIDISHSMILYGEDRITPAKKVALALSELITTRFPNDTLKIIVFGNDSWEIQLKDVPYLQVGPYHTNTVAGLELALDLLRKSKATNKQILMITDGKPTCIKKGKKYYKNAFGLDQHIITRTLSLAKKCRKLKIPITTFMIAKDPYLVQFVEEFTKINQGKAFYASLKELGKFVFMDYKSNKNNRK